MRLILYHSVESTCAQKVRFVLAEKGLDWTEMRLNLRKGDQFEPEYLKLNPKAVVPTLLHGDNVVRESSVIAEYIDDAFPDSPLRPAGAYERSVMRLVMKTFDEEVHPSVGVLSYAIFLRHQMNELLTAQALDDHFARMPDAARRDRQRGTHELGLDSPAAGPAIRTLRGVVAILDRCLQQWPWLAGNSPSLADFSAVPYVVRLRSLGLDQLWADRPRVSEWLETAMAQVESQGLVAPWGSASFATMVSGYVRREAARIEQLLASEA